MKKYTIYTDGSCLKNPGGEGGVAAVIIGDRYFNEVSGGYVAPTTCNQMEIMAAVAGLETLREPSEVTLISDSQYLVNTMSRGWKRKKNRPYWAKLDAMASKHLITWKWVKGHNGNHYNERCDHLANQAAIAAKFPEINQGTQILPNLEDSEAQLVFSLAS
jgi:ribonuclease HI